MGATGGSAESCQCSVGISGRCQGVDLARSAKIFSVAVEIRSAWVNLTLHAFGIAAIPRCAPSQAPTMEARPALSPPARKVARIALSKSSVCLSKAWIEDGKLLGKGQAWPKVKVASVTSFRVCLQSLACFAA